jgi:protein-L-isoaspartate(D-aspartate) O-methyltransferase
VDAAGNDSEFMEEAARLRRSMVENQLVHRRITDGLVLEAMGKVPRHAFTGKNPLELAYADGPLPIGCGQTISQPYIVAAMSEALSLSPGMKVLEIGTGSGYQTAVLSQMKMEVYTIERVPQLAAASRKVLQGLGFAGLHFRTGDGYGGWPEAAPFDGIIVTAAPESLPDKLAEQLAVGGRLVLPMGSDHQELYVIEKPVDGELSVKSLFPVRFVPMIAGLKENIKEQI